jgi:hypothetical protein
MKKKSQPKFKAPKDLEEALHVIISSLNEENRKCFKDAEEKNNILHIGSFFTGMNFRNSWGLWGKNDMTKYFNDIGVTHADDMSSIIFTSVHRRLNDKPIALQDQIKFYQDYWKNNGFLDGKPK